MIRCLLATVFLGWLIFPAAAAIDAAQINNAEYCAAPNTKKPNVKEKIDPVIVKAEVLLARALFSPGEIDGKPGENAQKALRAFAEVNGLASDNPITPEIWDKLADVSSDAIIVEYTISERDVKGPFLKKVPAKMDSMKGLKALSYTSPREAIAEKFHMSQALLAALNTGKKLDRAGEAILVANVLKRPERKLPTARIEVDKTRQTVEAFD